MGKNARQNVSTLILSMDLFFFLFFFFTVSYDSVTVKTLVINNCLLHTFCKPFSLSLAYGISQFSTEREKKKKQKTPKIR